jgi:N-methylhydantoinase A/oxoprolinase/acetone carboxylase beta subunit
MDSGAGSLVAGIDVGGTFTDLILIDSGSGAVKIAKTPTTIDNQARGVASALSAAEANIAALDLIVHGTTTTTNAVLEWQARPKMARSANWFLTSRRTKKPASANGNAKKSPNWC